MLVFKPIIGIFSIVIVPRTAYIFITLEGERHLIILSILQEKPVITVHKLIALTKPSKATIGGDIAALIVG